jgi:DNA-binding NarL/FixJ family response regulator
MGTLMNLNSGIRVLIADDHGLVRSGLKALIERMQGIEVIADAGDGQEAFDLVRSLKPDVVLADIEMPRLDGIALARRVGEELPSVRVLVISMYQSAACVFQALQAGVAGYLVKGGTPQELELAIRSVYAGRRYLSPEIAGDIVEGYVKPVPEQGAPRSLTPRQYEILKLIAEGYGTRQIAERLQISIKTVEAHRTELMQRLGIFEVAGLVRYALQTGVSRLRYG